MIHILEACLTVWTAVKSFFVFIVAIIFTIGGPTMLLWAIIASLTGHYLLAITVALIGLLSVILAIATWSYIGEKINGHYHKQN